MSVVVVSEVDKKAVVPHSKRSVDSRYVLRRIGAYRERAKLRTSLVVRLCAYKDLAIRHMQLLA
jgi:hypothetical protein